jgi:hypothetical protein
MSRGACVLVALPPALVAIGAIVLSALGVLGRNPFWSAEDFTMAEAAALRDQASVVALARAGEDPAARVRVRTGMFNNPRDLRMTPAEAAVRADRAEILEVLFLNGLKLDRQGTTRLLCLAAEWGSEEVVPYLTARFPDAAAEPCASGGERSSGR